MLIKKAAREELGDRPWPYTKDDKLELDIRLYFDTDRHVAIHDVDNRLKDIMDALQGALGGTKADRQRRRRLIKNDRQVYKVQVEKLLAPKQSGGLGHITIRKYTPRFVKRIPRQRITVSS